jgi:pimeloyl-ACP methyl ester carboxylesterase
MLHSNSTFDLSFKHRLYSTLLLILALLLAACSAAPTAPLDVAPTQTQLAQSGSQIEALPTHTPTSTALVPTPSPSQTPNPALRLIDDSSATGSLPFNFQIANLRPGQFAYSYLRPDNTQIDFLMYLPISYDPQKKWPLILYLHSSLELGSDLNLLRQRSLPKKLEHETDFPFIVISPQIKESYWYKNVKTLESLLDGMEKILPIDRQREYLTGFSLGGYGTWAYAFHYPGRFAAIAPVAGSLDEGGDFYVPVDFCRMKVVPAWAFHGDQDTSVSPIEDQTLVKALTNCGGEAKITLYPRVNHLTAGEMAYAEPDLYTWLLTHSKPGEKQ